MTMTTKPRTPVDRGRAARACGRDGHRRGSDVAYEEGDTRGVLSTKPPKEAKRVDAGN